jgi:hypothetical protein
MLYLVTLLPIKSIRCIEYFILVVSTTFPFANIPNGSKFKKTNAIRFIKRKVITLRETENIKTAQIIYLKSS